MIYLFGDLHGINNLNHFDSKHFKHGDALTKNDYVIVLGDFGIPWSNISTKGYSDEMDKLKWLNDKPWTTLFIDGNHENFYNLESFEEVDFASGKAHKLMPSIYHLERGYIFNIEDKKIFAFGGALSLDKSNRTPGLSWWPQELANKEEYERALNNLNYNHNKVDYVITHTTSNENTKLVLNINDDLLIHDPSCKFFDLFDKLITYKKWFFGHFHVDSTIRNRDGSSLYCLYNNYIELNTKADTITHFDITNI